MQKHQRTLTDKEPTKRTIYPEYRLMLLILATFFALAFLFDAPRDIFEGMQKILLSRSGLITDYIALGGFGATLVNMAMVGVWPILLLYLGRVKPNGSIIMGLWVTIGFAMFGKNLFNMLPLSLGVWLYAKISKQPLISICTSAMLVATLSPIVSELTFLPMLSRPLGALIGCLSGILIGIVFPPLASALVKVHNGYNLYNMGFAGGVIATFAACILKGFNIEIAVKDYWSFGNNLILAPLLYLLASLLIMYGIFQGGRQGKLINLRKITRHTGRLVTDYYFIYGSSTYINMGLLGALTTTVILIVGGDLNGPTIGAVFTAIGFAAFGNNLRNAIPVLIGALLCTYTNVWDPTEPLNMIAILFALTVAPIAGQFGWFWGIFAGFLHVSVANYVGVLNAGLNLYNNGFAGGFVAMLLVPIITTFRRKTKMEEE